MKNKVFGLGFSKTGTTSLERAMEILGYNVCRGNWKNGHTYYLLAMFMAEDRNEIRRMTQYWDAFFDGPFGGTDLYLDLQKWYPEAKFIHVVRKAEEWYSSFEKMILQFDPSMDTTWKTYHEKRFGSCHYFEKVFSINDLKGNKEKIVNHYKNYNKAVYDHFKDDPNYLQYDLDIDDPWGMICGFLDEKVPEASFPHENKAKTTGIKKANTGLKSRIKKILRS